VDLPHERGNDVGWVNSQTVIQGAAPSADPAPMIPPATRAGGSNNDTTARWNIRLILWYLLRKKT